MTRLTSWWTCLGAVELHVGLVPCDAGGDGPKSDLEARKHGTTPEGKP